jgi:DNA polymerase-4
LVRKILHVDLDAFFCSVEEKLNPELRGRPFIVGGTPDGRGVVASASYAARKYGVRSAMPTAQALRRCPELLIVHSRHGDYGKESHLVMDILRGAAPVVEQISIDEAFMDVSDDPTPGEEIARRLQTEIQTRHDLPTSWGVATNKLVAKIATEVGKPRGLIVVPPGGEAAFLAPLPVDMLWGVGPKTQNKLAGEGISLIGHLALLGPARLQELFGERGPELAARARGSDDSPVVAERDPRSMSNETTFARDVSDEYRLKQTLRSLSDELGRRLRDEGLAGWTVRIKLRWPDFRTLTRQARLTQPTDQDGEIYRVALDLFMNTWSRGRAVRLLGVGVSELGPKLRQLSLFERSWEHDEKLLEAIDSIRANYGPEAVRRAGSMRRGRRRHEAPGEERDRIEPDKPTAEDG